MVEENFRRALLLSRGDLTVFVTRPISGAFIAVCALLVLLQLFFWLRGRMRGSVAAEAAKAQAQAEGEAQTVADA
jgi:TctA family transporter